MNDISSRRGFLKKVAYTAPAVIALGALTLPASAQASVIFNQGQFTDGAQSFGATEYYDNVIKESQSGTLSYDQFVDQFNASDFKADGGLLQNFYNSLFRS